MFEEPDIQPKNQELNLLILDDDPTDSLLASQVAQAHGWKTTTCHTVQEAKATIEGIVLAFHPDAILLDMELEQEKGTQLCQIVRNPKSPTYLPTAWIIGYTCHTSIKTIQEMLSCGANDFLQKPASPEDIAIKLQVARFGHARNRAFKNRNRLLEEEVVKMCKESPPKTTNQT